MGLYYKTGLTIQCTCGVPRLHVWRASSVFARVRFQCPCGTPVPVWDSTNFRRAKVPMGLYYKIKLPLWCTCGVPVPVWGASSESDRVGHFFARVGCMPFLKGVKPQQEYTKK